MHHTSNVASHWSTSCLGTFTTPHSRCDSGLDDDMAPVCYLLSGAAEESASKPTFGVEVSSVPQAEHFLSAFRSISCTMTYKEKDRVSLASGSNHVWRWRSIRRTSRDVRSCTMLVCPLRTVSVERSR